jgi:hypothetical protein
MSAYGTKRTFPPNLRRPLYPQKRTSFTANTDSKAAGAWAYRPLCLRPPIQLPFPFGIRWASELRGLPHHQSRETFSRPAKSYLTNSAKCDRQRDSAATFRILHKRLRKRGAFLCRRRRSQREKHKISVAVPARSDLLECSLIPLSRGRA